MSRTRRQALGQHFLHHRPTIERILQTVAEQSTNADAILEVGPGERAITDGLIGLSEQLRKPLIVIERDRKLEPALSQIRDKAELHFLDAASPDFLKVFDNLKSRDIKKILFVSNLPYSASSQILANLTKVSAQLSGAVIMIQKELAQRMVAPENSKHRGSFSLLMQSYFNSTTCFDVSPGAFKPPPQVMSTVLSLSPLVPSLVEGLPSSRDFEVFCQKLFSHRRKMIRGIVSPAAIKKFTELHLTGTERPENLSLPTVLALFRAEKTADTN